jgi:hypothetical protein
MICNKTIKKNKINAYYIMSTEKSTIYNINWNLFYELTEGKLSNNKLSSAAVFEIVLKSYGIFSISDVDMSILAEGLTKKVIELKKEKNILYLFFDITLLILLKGIVTKDDEKILKDIIIYNMKRLCGSVEMVWE